MPTVERFPVDLSRAARVSFSHRGPQSFGYPRPGGRTHAGQDIAAPRGTPVLAPVSGRIVRVHAVDDSRCGFGVVIRDAARNLWTLCHFNAPPVVDAGDEVDPGDVLGVVGTSGDAPEGAPHLHIQCVNPQGIAVDLFGDLDDRRRIERGSGPPIVRRQLESVASSSGVGAGAAFVAIVAAVAYARRRGAR